jgi:hypothetical protein
MRAHPVTQRAGGRRAAGIRRQAGGRMPRVAGTRLRPAGTRRDHPVRRRADGRIPRAAGKQRVHLAGIKLNSEPAAAPIVPEASRGKTGAPSQVMIAEARQRISAAGGIKASLPPEAVEAVAAVAGAVAMVVAEAAGAGVVVVAADAAGADAADNRLKKIHTTTL